jgi:MoaA/NifB/PqqE/SkfB family radical SAM enzyme
MYNIEDVTSVHLEVTSKCQAKCPMCPRNMQGGRTNPMLELNEITLDQFKDWFSVDFIKQLKKLFMCGNYGDPIVAKDTLEIFQYLREHNESMILHMHTNGSGRSLKWWQTLAELKVKVIFGIDGMSDTHSIYRINTNWNKIIENAREFILHGGEARWDMIVFKHNEHQVEECRQFSKDLGFKEFTVKHTSRFRDGQLNVLDDQGKTVNILYPTTLSHSMINKIKEAKQDVLPIIHCKAKNDKQIYISATGNVTPCCWTDIEYDVPVATSRIDYLDKIGYWPNLKKSTLQEIFESNYFDEIEQSWTTCGLKACSKQCGSFDRMNAQWVERSKT